MNYKKTISILFAIVFVLNFVPLKIYGQDQPFLGNPNEKLKEVIAPVVGSSDSVKSFFLDIINKVTGFSFLNTVTVIKSIFEKLDKLFESIFSVTIVEAVKAVGNIFVKAFELVVQFLRWTLSLI